MDNVAESKEPTACIIVPTYNEAENIKSLLDAIFEQQEQRPNAMELHVLVVDDSSPDGTASIVKKYQEHNDSVHLLVRSEKNGLGAAYVAGMRHALEELSPDVILEMDADFSHDPADIHRLIAEVERGADFVIGSRYVPGGSIPDDWGLHRRAISAAANLFTKTVLSIDAVEDCTGGFRAMRADALSTIDLSSLDVRGYVFQVSLLDAFLERGFSVREVPIAFSDRKAGESKMRINDMVEGGRAILRLGADRWFGRDIDENAQTA